MAAITAALLIGLASATGHAARAAEDATGTWRMANGKVTVQLSPCGPGLCGRVVALKKPRDDQGRLKRDARNPNPALRQRPVVGLTILSDMRPAGDGKWSGTIYNPDDGNTYASRMQLVGPATLKVSGCVAGVLCKTLKFTRAD